MLQLSEKEGILSDVMPRPKSNNSTADRILRRLDLTVLDLLEGVASPLLIPAPTATIAGIVRNEQGDLARIGVEGWKDTGKLSKPGVQPHELF